MTIIKSGLAGWVRAILRPTQASGRDLPVTVTLTQEQVPWSIEISRETEARLTDEAQRRGISVDALLDRLMSDRGATAHAAGTGSTPKLPILHLGAMGALHRREIYDDAG
jgi:hypothetical protein